MHFAIGEGRSNNKEVWEGDAWREGGRALSFVAHDLKRIQRRPLLHTRVGRTSRHHGSASMRPAVIVILCDIEMQKELPPSPKSGRDRLLIPSLPRQVEGGIGGRDAMTLC